LFIRGTGIGAVRSSILLTSGGLSTADGGIWTLYGNNDYPGDTSIGSGGSRLQLGADNIVPDGVGKGNVNLTLPGATLDLNTHSETINGLTGVANTVVDTVMGGTPTLRVGNNNATSTFSGVIQNTGGTLSLIKMGGGTLTLAGANTYNGSTVVEAGVLALTGSGTVGSGLVDIKSGAKMNIEAGITNLVAGFSTNGVPTAWTGTIGSTGSGADHQDDNYFEASGSGVLLVAGGGVPPPAFTAGNALTMPGGVPTFSFDTVAGYKYRVTCNDNLTNTVWTPVLPPLPEGWTNGSGAPIILIDTNGVLPAYRFYRIEADNP
jgi:autotransporter-associated beta strand protein